MLPLEILVVANNVAVVKPVVINAVPDVKLGVLMLPLEILVVANNVPVVIPPVYLALPLTSSKYAGVTVPIPTLPPVVTNAPTVFELNVAFKLPLLTTILPTFIPLR